MILVDFSSIIHRMVFSSSKECKPKEQNGKYITEDYVGLTLDYILQELINIQLKHSAEFGEMVLLFDDWSKDYWRKDVYAGYKEHRASLRAATKINYKEVYVYINELVEHLVNNTPWRCVTVNKAEADDTILVLAREYSSIERILIYSPDKDFIQSQRNTENVSQYSPLTKKWLKPENKHDNMDHWVLEHCILGDSSDGVPKVVDHCEFSDSFIEHLIQCEVPDEYHEVHTFKYGNNGQMLDTNGKQRVLTSFDIQKQNRKGEDIGLDIYKDTRFGPSTLQKALDTHGSLDKFLDSHPLYREHYERNFQLVMEEGIPEYIWSDTLEQFNSAKLEYNKDIFEEYLLKNNLFNIKMELPKVFKNTDTISIENCGW